MDVDGMCVWDRYAMKRMRRKFKAMQRDVDGRAVDWRTLYNENKNADANASKKKKEKRKKRDGLKDQLEKDKKKRYSCVCMCCCDGGTLTGCVSVGRRIKRELRRS